MTAVGGLIALVQFVDGDKGFFFKIMIATSLMFLSALLAFFAQFSLVDRIRQAHGLLRKRERKAYRTRRRKSWNGFLKGWRFGSCPLVWALPCMRCLWSVCRISNSFRPTSLRGTA